MSGVGKMSRFERTLVKCSRHRSWDRRKVFSLGKYRYKSFTKGCLLMFVALQRLLYEAAFSLPASNILVKVYLPYVNILRQILSHSNNVNFDVCCD